MSRIYLATGLQNQDNYRAAREVIMKAGHEITYDWTLGFTERFDRTVQYLEDTSKEEVKGVLSADLVVAMLPGGRGTHAELGMAIAKEIPVIFYSPKSALMMPTIETCAFYWHPGVLKCTGPFGAFLENLPRMIPEVLEKGHTNDLGPTVHVDGGRC